MKTVTLILIATTLFLAGCSTTQPPVMSYAWAISALPVENGKYKVSAKLVTKTSTGTAQHVAFEIKELTLPSLELMPNEPAECTILDKNKHPASKIRATLNTTGSENVLTYEVMIKDADTTHETKGEITI